MSTLAGIPVDANEFAGEGVLVTGGTKGAGKAIADRFQRGGATVIVIARSAPAIDELIVRQHSKSSAYYMLGVTRAVL